MAISTEYGADPNYFGHADYAGNIAAGQNPLQILNYLRSNVDKLRGANVPGGGGIYDEAVKEASLFQQKQMMETPKVNFEELLRKQAEETKAFQLAAAQESSRLQQEFENRIFQQQSTFQQQLAAQQQQAQESQRQLMIQMQRPDRAPAEVRMSGGDQPLRRRGTTGYFGREGMRISGLNVPTSGLAISPNSTMRSGSFA